MSDLDPGRLVTPTGCSMTYTIGECETFMALAGMSVRIKFKGSCPAVKSLDDSSRSLVMYILTGILGLFGLTLIVLLVVSRFTEKAKPPPNRTGTPNVDAPVGWGPFGFLFPKSWVYVWWGYLAMVVLSGIVFPAISKGLPLPSSNSATIETILIIGPFIHCILMPILWVHKHREDKKWIENHLNEDVVVMTELDPEAKTTIFSRKLACAKSCTVLLFKLTLGLVDLALRIIKYATGGTINLSAFWFPAPFYTFWKAKLQIDLIQVDGAKICTNANQGDAYMKFCTEAMLNWWTLGIYGKCCGSRTSYGRWLDRHVLWQGAPPSGYTNRELPPFELAQAPSPPQTGADPATLVCPPSEFRIFDEKLSCCQKVKVYFFTLLLTLLGGFLTWVPYAAPARTSEPKTDSAALTSSASPRRRFGGLWPFGLVLPWYLYTVKLGNMMFGGSNPTFAEEFTWCNYIIKYYTIGCCGLCGFPVKVWVDKCIVMGTPTFDEDMAKRDLQADAANPKELSRRFSNQSASGPPVLLDPKRRVSFVSAQDLERGVGALATEVPSVSLELVRMQSVGGGESPSSVGPAASADTKQKEAAKEESGTQKAPAPQSLAALLAACGLEHRAKNFEDEGYTLDNLLSSMTSGENVAKSDLRELKLTLGECRQLITQLGASK